MELDRVICGDCLEVLKGLPDGGVVLDPFAGSGTTLVAAILEGRRYIGVEMNPEYVAIAKGRCAAARAEVASKPQTLDL